MMDRTKRTTRAILWSVALLAGWALGCGDPQSTDPRGSSAASTAPPQPTRGPHGGRTFESRDLRIEVEIFETGVPPEFRIYFQHAGRAVDPAGIDAEIQLTRLGGRTERIRFERSGDHLVGDRPVLEPHSFDAELRVSGAVGEHRVVWQNHENRLALSPEQQRAAGIGTALAGPATVRVLRPLSGRIVANEDALAHMAPRFPGIVRSVHKRIGDPVAKGDLLAVIESNESLHPYEIRAQLAGVVLERDVAPGEFVSTDRPILTIGNLSTVWVDLDVYRRDFAHLARGQRVEVDAEDGRPPAEATISYLAPIGAENTQTLVARAVLANGDGRWRPGQFVSAQVRVREVAAAVAVPSGAVQRIGEWQVVFVVVDDVFEARPVALGARDDAFVEVLSGLEAGERIAVSGSFILKAELGKSGLSHGS